MNTGYVMDDQFWLKLWSDLVKLMPAFGGSLISLKYMPKEETGWRSIATSFACSLVLAIWGGGAWIEYRGINPESLMAQAIIMTIGIAGLVIVNKLMQAIKSISASELKAWILETLRKMIN